MRAAPRPARAVLVIPVLCAGMFGACGGGESERQDANDRGGTFDVEVVRASFPARQTAGSAAELHLDVKNTGTAAVPNLAISLDGLRRVREQPDLADPKRPVWIIDGQPDNGVTTYVDTWAEGALAPGETRRHRWLLTPTKPGATSLRWAIAGNLTGGARVQLAGGKPAEGQFAVRITAGSADAAGRVDPATGALRDRRERSTGADR